MGGKVASNIAAGEYWRLITPIMLHAGLFHLLINVFTQCMFGIQLEREWGASQIAVIYAVAGIYGNVLSVLFAPNALSIGCSGSVFGLFGAQVRSSARGVLSDFRRNRLSACLSHKRSAEHQRQLHFTPGTPPHTHAGRWPTSWACGGSWATCRRKCSFCPSASPSSSSSPSPSALVSICRPISVASSPAWCALPRPAKMLALKPTAKRRVS
jgi:hypothetical protein